MGAYLTVGRLGWVRVFDAVLVNATDVVRTNPIKIEYQGGAFSLYLQTTSVTGTPDITVQLEESNSETGTFVVPDDVSDIFTNLADELWHIKGFQPDPTDWIKLKITGNAANPADTIVTGWVFFGG